jgi:hypothetical protein
LHTCAMVSGDFNSSHSRFRKSSNQLSVGFVLPFVKRIVTGITRHETNDTKRKYSHGHKYVGCRIGFCDGVCKNRLPTNKRPSGFYSGALNRGVVNTNVVAVVLVSVLCCGILGVGVNPQVGTTETVTQQSATDDGLGDDISVFMQRSAAAVNGSVDSGMWLAAFETAENQSRKEALVNQRAETLGARLDRLEERVDEFNSTETNRSVAHRARWARLAADAEALRTSISEAKTAAAKAGVNTTELDRLSRRAANISIPTAAWNENWISAAVRDGGAVTSHEQYTIDGTTYRGP